MAQRLISCGKLSDSFVLGEYIGKGNFAMVFKATAVARSAVPGEGLPPPPTEYAVKRTDRKGLREGDKEGVYEEVRDIFMIRRRNMVRYTRKCRLVFGRVICKKKQAACYQHHCFREDAWYIYQTEVRVNPVIQQPP